MALAFARPRSAISRAIRDGSMSASTSARGMGKYSIFERCVCAAEGILRALTFFEIGMSDCFERKRRPDIGGARMQFNRRAIS